MSFEFLNLIRVPLQYTACIDTRNCDMKLKPIRDLGGTSRNSKQPLLQKKLPENKKSRQKSIQDISQETESIIFSAEYF